MTAAVRVTVFVVLFLSAGFASATSRPSQTNTSSLNAFRFAEIKSYKETSGTPPTLDVTFDISCNEAFVKIFRHDKVDEKSKKVTIAIGVLVEEDAKMNCTGKFKEMTVSAGTTFSGRPYEISLIHKQSPQLTVREQ